MEDRFKFRFWNNKNMIYDDIPHLELYNSDDYIWQQCTGLKDKNGKLIYEGDICKLWSDEWESIKEVIYKDCSFHFRKPNSMQADSPLYCYAIDYLGHFKHINIEIIGSIYENKDLLNA